jgi:hypothetical protein
MSGVVLSLAAPVPNEIGIPPRLPAHLLLAISPATQYPPHTHLPATTSHPLPLLPADHSPVIVAPTGALVSLYNSPTGGL